jgi:hypothetical protein
MGYTFPAVQADTLTGSLVTLHVHTLTCHHVDLQFTCHHVDLHLSCHHVDLQVHISHIGQADTDIGSLVNPHVCQTQPTCTGPPIVPDLMGTYAPPATPAAQSKQKST